MAWQGDLQPDPGVLVSQQGPTQRPYRQEGEGRCLAPTRRYEPERPPERTDYSEVHQCTGCAASRGRGFPLHHPVPYRGQEEQGVAPALLLASIHPRTWKGHHKEFGG